jgi:hypothetical protein
MLLKKDQHEHNHYLEAHFLCRSHQRKLNCLPKARLLAAVISLDQVFTRVVSEDLIQMKC